MSKTSQRKQDRLFRLKKAMEAGKAKKPFPFKSATKEEIKRYRKAFDEIGSSCGTRCGNVKKTTFSKMMGAVLLRLRGRCWFARRRSSN
jgi:hypothetical protein